MQTMHPPSRRLRIVALLAPLLAILAGTGCSSVYYDAMERLGYEKRDVLVGRIEDAREAQEGAREQFESALDQFIAATDFEGGDLEETYRALEAEYEASEASADRVGTRIDRVEQVADDLFAEWEDELDLYTDDELRATSAEQLERTRTRYAHLIGAMREVEASIEPVLETLRDRVLFLKHNLNAQAIASLREDRRGVQSDVRNLIRQMNASIAEADRFIDDMAVAPPEEGA